MSELLKPNRHVRPIREACVFKFYLPDGTQVEIDSAQVPLLTIERHGNAGRSKVTMPLVLELEVQGEAEQLKRQLSCELSRHVSDLYKKNAELAARLADAQTDKPR